MKRVYNRKKDKPDSRNWLYSKAMDKVDVISPVVDLRPQCPLIYDQGDLGSCTGNACAGALEYLEIQQLKAGSGAEIFDKALEPLSRLFIYYNERRLDNTTGEDAGATIHDSIRSVLYFGACRESVWPYDVAKAYTKPTDPAYVEAFGHKISKYYSFLDLDHIKHSLAAGFPVVIGITIYESFESESVAQTGLVPMPNKSVEQVLGGHAVLVVGYDDVKQHVIVRNSWGAEWGDKGYFYLPYAFMEDPELAEDWWSIRK